MTSSYGFLVMHLHDPSYRVELSSKTLDIQVPEHKEDFEDMEEFNDTDEGTEDADDNEDMEELDEEEWMEVGRRRRKDSESKKTQDSEQNPIDIKMFTQEMEEVSREIDQMNDSQEMLRIMQDIIQNQQMTKWRYIDHKIHQKLAILLAKKISFVVVEKKKSYAFYSLLNFIIRRTFMNEKEKEQAIEKYVNQLTIYESQIFIDDNELDETIEQQSKWMYSEEPLQKDQKMVDKIRKSIQIAKPNQSFVLDIPKGKKYMTEQSMSCAIREFEEETGINFSRHVKFSSDKFINFKMVGTDGRDYSYKLFVGIIDERISIESLLNSTQILDKNEVKGVKVMTLEQIQKTCANQCNQQNKNIILLLRKFISYLIQQYLHLRERRKLQAIPFRQNPPLPSIYCTDKQPTQQKGQKERKHRKYPKDQKWFEDNFEIPRSDQYQLQYTNGYNNQQHAQSNKKILRSSSIKRNTNDLKKGKILRSSVSDNNTTSESNP